MKIAPSPRWHSFIGGLGLETAVGPSPVSPDLIITFVPDDLPSFGALIRAAKCGLVQLDGRWELLETFLDVFALPQSAQAGWRMESKPHSLGMTG
ncbi:MAG: hypothetical protein ACRDOI_26810 [Trebonia sp.]